MPTRLWSPCKAPAARTRGAAATAGRGRRAPQASDTPAKPRAAHPLAAQPLSPLPAGSTRRPLARCLALRLSSFLLLNLFSVTSYLSPSSVPPRPHPTLDSPPPCYLCQTDEWSLLLSARRKARDSRPCRAQEAGGGSSGLPSGGNQGRRVGRHVHARARTSRRSGAPNRGANPPRTRGTDLDLLARIAEFTGAESGKAERGGCSKLPVIRRRVRSAPVPPAAAGISSARAGRGSGGRVAGSRLRSALASGRRPTRRRRETLRAACRRPLGRGPRLP
jgi:hypothetical protein